MADGMKSFFVQVFFNGTLLENIEIVTDTFKYIYSESENDVCSLDLKAVSRTIADHDCFLPKAEWTVIWGYVGTTEISKRKVYLQSTRWNYGPEIKANCLLTDKAVILKDSVNTDIHKDVSIIDLLMKPSKENGLSLSIQIPKAADDEYKTLKVYDPKDPNAEKFYKKLQAKSKAANVGRGGNDINKVNKINYFAPWGHNSPNQFKIHGQLPQAGRSILQLATDFAMREMGGKTVISTRDDGITVKKRDFSKAPVDEFEYGGTDGRVLEFSPEYKSKLIDGTSQNISYGGWDASSKKFINGDANGLYDNIPQSLVKLISMVELLYYYPDSAKLGKFKLDPVTGALTYISVGTGLGRAKETITFKGDTKLFQGQNTKTFFEAKGDNTAAYFKNFTQSIVTIGNFREIVKNRIDQYRKNKVLYDPASKTTNEMFQTAANLRNEAELKKSPATLETEGIPKLEDGQVIKLLGVAKVHAGLYYTVRVEHSGTKGGGYKCTTTMVRNGNDYKAPNALDVSKLGKKVNKKQTTSKSNTGLKTVKVKNN